MYGWRLAIGLLLPGPNSVMEPEFNRIAPRGVAIYATRMSLNQKYDPNALVSMSEQAERGAAELAQAGVDVINYGCTSGSFVQGAGYDIELSRKIQETVDIPTITTSTAVLEALKLLGMKRIAVASPYTKEISERGVAFLEGNGFEVTKALGMGITEAVEIGKVDPQKVYRFSKSVYTNSADGLAILCTNLRTIDVIEQLESDIGKPVVTANQATIAVTLRKMNVREKIEGFGQLFDA